jgi:hypothetical protein
MIRNKMKISLKNLCVSAALRENNKKYGFTHDGRTVNGLEE